MTTVKSGTRIHFSLVRFVPDSLRGELFNVAILAVADGQLHVRTLSHAPRILKSLMPASVWRDLESLEKAIRSRFRRGFPEEALDGTISERAEPTVGFLRFLAHEGMGAFIIDEPRWRETIGELESAEILVKQLSERLVEPISAKTLRSGVRRQRARTVVRELLNRSGIDSLLVPRRVLVRPSYATEARDFGFAMANGKITLGQTIDFDVCEPKMHADSAIALAVEMQMILREEKPCLNVVRSSGDIASEREHIRRLEQVGETLVLPQDEGRLILRIREMAHRDVAQAMREKGFEVISEGDTIEASLTE